jgi:hypothetical protein
MKPMSSRELERNLARSKQRPLRSSASRSPAPIAAPMRIMVEPTATGRKWRALFDGKQVCISAWPFVMAARQLLAAGHPPDTLLEMWRPGATEWALRGRLGAVAATVIEGETASRRAINGPPMRVLGGARG